MSNRLVMWYVHSGTEGGAQELWRGSQAWIWMGKPVLFLWLDGWGW